MADNMAVTEGSGKTIGADEISDVLYQRIKLIHGADGTNDGDVDSGNPLPVTDSANEALLTTIDSDTSAIATDIAALEVLQTTISEDTTSIDGKITACNTGAVVLAAGSDAIGKLAANSGVDIGDVDVTSTVLPTVSSISNGSKDVTTAGTAEALAGSTACKKIFICSKDTNTGKIFVGGSGVSSTSGAFIYPGGSMTLEIANLSLVYIDSAVNGDGVQFTYLV